MTKLAEPVVAKASTKVATDTLDPLVLDFVEWVAGEQSRWADVYFHTARRLIQLYQRVGDLAGGAAAVAADLVG